MVRTRAALLLLGIVALLGACGDDESGGGEDTEVGGGLSEAEQEYADAFAATLADEEDGLGAPADDAQCMGDAVMAELGTDVFEDAGVKPDDIDADGDPPGALLGDGTIPREQALAIVDAWEDCADLVELLIASGGSELELDPEGTACLREGLAEDDLAKRALIGPLVSEDGSPDEETMSDFLQLLEECGSDEGTVLDQIAASLLDGSSLTDEQARCLAQGVVDELGVDRMSELFSSGAFDAITEDGQSEATGALLQAAAACEVPLTAFG